MAEKEFGRPTTWNEKKTRTTMSLTPEAVERLESLSQKMGISKSEIIERFARGLLGIEELPEDRHALGESYVN